MKVSIICHVISQNQKLNVTLDYNDKCVRFLFGRLMDIISYRENSRDYFRTLGYFATDCLHAL